MQLIYFKLAKLKGEKENAPSLEGKIIEDHRSYTAQKLTYSCVVSVLHESQRNTKASIDAIIIIVIMLESETCEQTTLSLHT